MSEGPPVTLNMLLSEGSLLQFAELQAA